MLTPDGAPDSTVTPILSTHLFHCIPSPLHLFLFLCPFTVSSTFLSPPSASLFSLAPSFGFSLCFACSPCGSFLPARALRGEGSSSSLAILEGFLEEADFPKAICKGK